MTAKEIARHQNYNQDTTQKWAKVPGKTSVN